MKSPRLTIGMATINDFDGVYFSLQAIRLYHAEHMHEVELLVVDQSNNPSHSSMTNATCVNVGARYVPMTQPQGTSPSRNRVFEEAQGEFVLCIDSHVLLQKGAVGRLLHLIDVAGPHLYSGPMLMDNFIGFTTHFNREWRSEMYGTWGRAWQCKCGTNFSCVLNNDRVNYITLPENLPVTGCPTCGLAYPPDLAWAAHEAVLEHKGYLSLGHNVHDAPFEIPGQGLGLFGCRKDAWLGFNQHALGFGAEELNIHDLYRQKGYKCYCLPWLQWVHRFGRASGTPYTVERYAKVRNYVLWHQQLGKPLDDIYTHFVASKLLSEDYWKYLLEDPITHINPPQGCATCPGLPRPPVLRSTEDAFGFVQTIARDINEHMPKLRELADVCPKVTEFSIRRESTIAFLTSKCERLVSHNSEGRDKLLSDLRSYRAADSFTMADNPLVPQEIEPTDLLFLNDRHTGERIGWCLERFAPKVSRYIVLHNTGIYGEIGEDGNYGIMSAARIFMRQHPEWSVVYHSTAQYGLTVLGRKAEDKQRLPGIARRAANFAVALTEHIADGATLVDLPVLEARLDVCSGCEHRNGDNCSVCGCPLAKKASWKVSECPLGLWPANP